MVFYLGPNDYDLGGTFPHITPLGDNYFMAYRFHPDDNHDAHVLVFSVGDDGTLTPVVKQFDPFVDPRGTPPRQMAVVQTAKYHAVCVYHQVTDDVDNGITGYRFDPNAGTLTQTDASSYPNELFDPGEEPTLFNWTSYDANVGGIISRGRRLFNFTGDFDDLNDGWRGIVARFRAGDSEPSIVKTSKIVADGSEALDALGWFSDSLCTLYPKSGGGWWVPMVTEGGSEYRLYSLDAEFNPDGTHIVSPITDVVGGPEVEARRDGLYATFPGATNMFRAAPTSTVEELTGFVAAGDWILPYPTVRGNLWYFVHEDVENPEISFSGKGTLYDHDGNVVIDVPYDASVGSTNEYQDGSMYRSNMTRDPILSGGKFWYPYIPETYPGGTAVNLLQVIGEDGPIPFDFGTGPRTGRFSFE